MRDPVAPSGVAIGVDIGGTNVRAARIERSGRLSGHVAVRTDSAPSVAELVLDLCAGLMADDVTAIGIGIPGRLDREGTILSAGYVDLAGVPLGTVVEQAIGRPTVLANDASMALRAELAVGAASSARDVVMFTVGTGIGGAVAIDRTVAHGRGNAGQLGHLGLDPDGPACKCGRRGCSEMLASGTALNRLMAEAGLPVGTTAEWLLAHWQDDARANAALERWARAWRDAIDTVVAVLDPELVVLGGGLGSAAVSAIEACHPATSPWFTCAVMPALLGDEAGVIGAGLRALEA